MKKVITVLALILLAGAGYYFLSPLVNNIEVNDALPESFTQDPEEGGSVYAMRGPFAVNDTIGHPAEGTVSYYESEDSQFLRFENFKTINGPRLNLYLAKDKEAKEFIDLGPIRGTEGEINYEIPEGINIDEYPFVLHWCVPFGVLFNYAEVTQ